MSKKDFDEYYKSLCDQYVQLQEELDAFQKLLEDKVVEPERVENLKKTIQPVIDTYQMVSWVAFLLNKPVNNKKADKYNSMMRKKLNHLNPSCKKESVLMNNDTILDALHRSNELQEI